MKTARLGIVMVAAGLIAISTSVSAATLTVKGTVSDSMCAAKHTGPSKAADCTRECVKKGAQYVLVTADGKVYTLKADTSSPGSTMEALEHVAGDQVEIRGELNGTTLTVRVLSKSE